MVAGFWKAGPVLKPLFRPYNTARLRLLDYLTWAWAAIWRFEKPLFKRAGGFAAHDHIPSGDDDLLVNATATSHQYQPLSSS